MSEKPRPYVICHMYSSVDGRLDTSRFSKPLGKDSPDDIGDCYYTIADDYKPDAYMLGRNTVHIHFFNKTYDHSNKKVATSFETFKGTITEKKNPQVVFDSKGSIYYDSGSHSDGNIIAVLGESVSEDYLQLLREKNISYLFAGKDGRDYKLALEKLYSEFGMRKVLLEGGGVINGSFLKLGLLDEISIVLSPEIDGLSGAASIFEYKGQKDELPAAGQSLEFLNFQLKEDGCVWLTYKVHHNQ